jgi:toxin ParE1/3/4
VKRVEISATAMAEIDRAEAWYENRKEGLGGRFLKDVLETADRIALNPEGYAKLIKEARKADLRKFPYSLWFTVENDVLVIACLHGRRDRQLAKERALRVLEMPEDLDLGKFEEEL